MFKNQSGQKVQLFAFNTTTGAPVSGDAANITAYVSKDHGSVTVLGDTSAAEMDATNAKGIYVFDLTQGETNADELTFSAKSSTSNVSITPRFISTVPQKFTTMVIDAAGLVDANTVKVGPTGAGTAQTAGNIVSTATAIKAVTDKLNTTFEAASGSPGEYAFTEDALRNAPAGTGGGGGPSAGAIADAVWDEVLSGHSGAGSAGKIVGDALDAAISTRATQASVDTIDANVDAVLVDTGTDIPATLSTLGGYVDTEVAAIKAKTDLIPAAPAAVGDIPTAIQNADALLNRDLSAGTDSGSPTVRTVRQALRFLRNKWTITGSNLSVKKEDDSTESWSATVATTPGADPITGTDPA